MSATSLTVTTHTQLFFISILRTSHQSCSQRGYRNRQNRAVEVCAKWCGGWTRNTGRNKPQILWLKVHLKSFYGLMVFTKISQWSWASALLTFLFLLLACSCTIAAWFNSTEALSLSICENHRTLQTWSGSIHYGYCAVRKSDLFCRWNLLITFYTVTRHLM